MTIKQEAALKLQHRNRQIKESTFVALLDHTRYAIPAEIYIDEDIAW